MKKQKKSDQTHEHLVLHLAATSKRIEKKLDKFYTAIGLKKSSYEVLAALHNTTPTYSLTPNELLAVTHITSGTMTNRIDKLSKKGWVSRNVNKKDKRSVTVSLTESGKKIIDEAIHKHNQALKDACSVWSQEEQEQLTALLLKEASLC